MCARTALLKTAELVSSLVLMEASSTMKEFEIQRILIKVCTGPPQVDVILALCSSIRIAVPCSIST